MHYRVPGAGSTPHLHKGEITSYAAVKRRLLDWGALTTAVPEWRFYPCHESSVPGDDVGYNPW